MKYCSGQLTAEDTSRISESLFSVVTVESMPPQQVCRIVFTCDDIDDVRVRFCFANVLAIHFFVTYLVSNTYVQ